MRTISLPRLLVIIAAVALLVVADVSTTPAAGAAPGCNNVTPTVSESAAAYAARVTPAANLIAIWEHDPVTNTYRGYSPQGGAANDLPRVTRLRPVFVCVRGPASLDQPPA